MANIKKLPLFVRCVIQNFPFIEEDFDALTNYELICKVVKYLNKIITSQNEVIGISNNLQEAFAQLQSYVNNYFDNLDVQEEINNKLDAMVEAGTLQEIIGEYLNATAVWGFDSVTDMKTSTNLINGSFAKTLGYYAKNDEGGATYKIRTITNEDVVDEFKIIALNDNTLIAELIIANDTVNVKQAGCKGDNITDDTINFQKALNSGFNIIVPKGTYLITEKMVMPFNKHLRGTINTECIINSTIESDYIIQYGSSYDYQGFRGSIENLRFQCGNADNAKSYGIYLNSGCKILNCQFYSLSRAIYRVSSYSDLIKIEDCVFSYCVPNGNYVVNLGGSGDSLTLNRIKWAQYANDSTQYNGIYISACRGGSINDSILTNIHIARGSIISINGLHTELLDTTYKIEDSNVEFNNVFKWKNKTQNDIIITTGSSAMKSVIVKLNNVYFQRENRYFNESVSPEINEISHSVILTLNNVYRLIDFADAGEFSNMINGIKITNKEDFNTLSGIYSKNSVVSYDSISVNPQITHRSGGLGQMSKINRIKWLSDDAAMVYYKAIVICDETRKIIAGASNESSISSVVSNGDGVQININNNDFDRDIYLFSGTTSGSYTKKCKISLTERSRLYDTGVACNLTSWDTVEATDGLTGYNDVQNYIKTGDNVVVFMNNTPAYGTWKKYDRIINTNTNTGQPISWMYNGSTWIAQGSY